MYNLLIPLAHGTSNACIHVKCQAPVHLSTFAKGHSYFNYTCLPHQSTYHYKASIALFAKLVKNGKRNKLPVKSNE